MLSSGLDRVTPAQSMWPLFCGEVGLSYEQEEKFRICQRLKLQSVEVWVDRHITFAAGKAIQSAHDATQALALRLGQRERSTMSLLSNEQKKRFLQWSNRNRSRLAALTSNAPRLKDASPHETSPSQHQAANLYILNHKLQSILQKIPRSAPLVTGPQLKKLLRRPSFESLGCRQGEGDRESSGMDRSRSFSSSGSLKRSASEMSMDGSEERPPVQSICPVEAQSVAAAALHTALGHIKDIMPPPPTPTMAQPIQFVIPTPAPVTSSSTMSRCMSMPSAPVSYEPSFANQQRSSFLPTNLNIVPEEMWPGDAEDLLLNLVDEEDWAIGEGIDMEMQ